MMWPYYAQNPDTPLSHVYEQIGWNEIKWIVSIGAVFALCTNLLGSMFPLPRILYAMSSDGLLYGIFKRVNTRTKTPLNATLLAGALAAVMSMVFDLHQLIDMMSIGTLMAYTLVAICILVLRYQDDVASYTNEPSFIRSTLWWQLFNLNFIKNPDKLSSSITQMTIVLFSVFTAIFCLFFGMDWEHNLALEIILIGIGVLLLVFFVVIARQPQSESKSSFKVPAVPFLPILSIFMNLYLMFQLDVHTWIRFGIWLIIGYLIYFSYGIRHSIEGYRKKFESSNEFESQNGKQILDSNGHGRFAVEAHTMQSIDDLHNANIEFSAGSNVNLSHH
ncbi:cationic amino acid transporter 3-like [Sitodiplosis mosellana]|uniref:cationic amino acid transporter 3-like n=1 Tax=Sitodiplosis mosellana TaxID=263140 RepID=UPI002443DA4A|nr:cationic amino acid transporter 3-like [Sitodiplosis mosellana]